MGRQGSEAESFDWCGRLEKPHGRLMHLYKSRKRKVCSGSVNDRIKVR